MSSYAFGDEKCLCLCRAGDVKTCPVHPFKERGLYEDLTIRDKSRSKAQSRVIGGIAAGKRYR